MAQAEALGRSLSISIQHVSEHNRMQLFTEIVNQWSGIGGSRQGGFGANRTRSFPDAIASIIMSQYLNNGNNVDTHAQVIYDTVGTASSFVNYGDWQSATATATPNTFASVISVSLKNADTCPECHETALVRENGCVTCKVCGHSEC